MNELELELELELEGWKSLAIDRHNRILELATELNKARDEVEALEKECARLEEDNRALLENPGDAL